MTKLCEYRDLGDAPRSKRTTLAARPGAFGQQHALIHGSAGWEPAGPVARWTDEYWAHAVTYLDGTKHGHRFKAETAARERFDRFSTPIGEIFV